MLTSEERQALRETVRLEAETREARCKEAARRILEVSTELHLTIAEFERVVAVVKKRAVMSILDL